LRYLIAGIDPGTTVGIAVFDLSRNLLFLASEREMGKERIVERIKEFGKPAVVACDVTPAPDLIIKIAAAFNARIFTPEKNLTEEEKRELTRGYACANPHEADAVASVVRAFNAYDNKFRLIERVLRERGLAEKADEVKYLVLNAISIQNALLMLEIEREGKVKVPAMPSPAPSRLPEPKYLAEMKRIIAANMELRKAVERLEAEKRRLEEKMRLLERGVAERLARDKEIRRRDGEIARLRRMLAKRQRPKVNLKKLPAKYTPDIEQIVEEYREKR